MSSNIYSSPEAYSLTTVVSADVGGPYEFDMFVVWKDDQDEYYWSSDSGCSCPVPFEAVKAEDLNRGTVKDALIDFQSWAMERNARVRDTEHAEAILKGLVG